MNTRIIKRLFRELPPGSYEAYKWGCLCPAGDSPLALSHPQQSNDKQYCINSHCPIHSHIANGGNN